MRPWPPFLEYLRPAPFFPPVNPQAEMPAGIHSHCVGNHHAIAGANTAHGHSHSCMGILHQAHDNGEVRIYDAPPLIRGDWFGQLRDCQRLALLSS